MPEFVDKIRTMVRFSRPSEPPSHGVLCLGPPGAYRTVPETILERLNAPERVFPIESTEGGTVVLVNRLDLEWVAPRPGTEPVLIGPANFLVTHQEPVCIRFRHGESLEGVLQMELPEGINRVSDFLNSMDDFFPLVTADGVFLVNKLHVREVQLFRASPRPRAA